MKPILYSAAETAYITGGLGRLSDAISCVVTEELNGAYELEMQYPAGGIHASDIAEGCQIFAAYDETGDRQPFRIYRKADTIDGMFTVFARHIAGDLSRIPVMPYTAENLTAALAGLVSHTAVTNPFTFLTSMSVSAPFGLEVPTSAKAVLGSGEGSIIGVYGGEVKYDKRTVTVLTRRGTDTSVVIRYGKNMTGLEVVNESSAAYNAVVPFCKTQEGVITCSPPVVAHGAYTNAVPLDLSDAFDGYVPSAAQLEMEALAWLNKHQPWISEKAIKVSFVQLRDTTEYADFAPLERVVLGDGIKVRHTLLSVDADFRVIKTVYDVLQDRYSELLLGREIETVATMMHELVAKLREARDIAQEIANGTYSGGTFINGQLIFAPSIYGGEIAIGSNGSGYNFNVDSSGNVETNGSVHLQGPDTKIVAPKILANAFSVFPEDADDEEIEALTIPAGFNLYDRIPGVQGLFHLLKIYQFDMYTVFSSPGSGFANLDFTQLNINGKAYYFGSGQSGGDAEIATLGDIPDVSEFVTTGQVQSMVSGFVTAAEVQAMIDAAIGPQP